MKRLLILCCCLFSIAVHAQIVDVTKTVTGVGESYQDALNSALLTAVQQVRGVEVGTERQLQTTVNYLFSYRADIVVEETSIKKDIYNDSKGWIKSFEVVKISKPESKDGVWQVQASVTVPRFESDLAVGDSRYTLAVMPFISMQSRYYINGDWLASSQVRQTLRDQLLTRFSQNGRFAMLNRAQGQVLEQEFSLLASDAVSKEDASRLGNVAGADFILLGVVDYIGKPKKSRSYYGADFNDNRIQAELSYQIVEVATQRILWADSIDSSFILDHDFETRQVFEQLANQVSNEATQAVYPLRIMDIINDEQIFLSQGGKAIQVGDSYVVKAPAKTMQDPDSGKTMQIEGMTIAVLEIVDVGSNHSIAKLITGDVKQISANSIVRKATGEVTKPAEPKPLTPGSSEKPLSWD